MDFESPSPTCCQQHRVSFNADTETPGQRLSMTSSPHRTSSPRMTSSPRRASSPRRTSSPCRTSSACRTSSPRRTSSLLPQQPVALRTKAQIPPATSESLSATWNTHPLSLSFINHPPSNHHDENDNDSGLSAVSTPSLPLAHQRFDRSTAVTPLQPSDADPGMDWVDDSKFPPRRDAVILREEVLLQLRRIIDPDLDRDIVSLGFVKDLQIDYDNASVSLTLELTTSACPVRDLFVVEIERQLNALGWILSVDVNVTSRRPESATSNRATCSPNLANVSHIIAVASCKGGVGKSSIACNMAYMLATLGARVGLVDADVYGPSLPYLIGLESPSVYFSLREPNHGVTRRSAHHTVGYEGSGEMLTVSSSGLGTSEEDHRSNTLSTHHHHSSDSSVQQDTHHPQDVVGQSESTEWTPARGKVESQERSNTTPTMRDQLVNQEGGLVPLLYGGVKLMSYGYLKTSPVTAVRGPVASLVVHQMLTQTLWGDLDYLLIDMPPGTGDVHLTIAQSVQVTAAVMVTTPQQLSLVDVERGILMFNELKIPTLAVVENMSQFICPCCNTPHDIFSKKLKALCDHTVSQHGVSLPQAQLDEYRNVDRLVEQFGIAVHAKIPIHQDFATLRFSAPTQFQRDVIQSPTESRVWNRSSSLGLSVTDVASSQVPAAQVPASQVPASQVPAAQVPASQVPASQVPASQVPASQVPASQVPASQVPASQVPASQVQASQVPTSQVPASQAPASQVPASQALESHVPASFCNNDDDVIFPFVRAFDEKHPVWRVLRSLCQDVVRELSALRWASSDRIPTVKVLDDGRLVEMVMKRPLQRLAVNQLEHRTPNAEGQETILIAPSREVRLHCRCAECVDEFTGRLRLNPRKVSSDIRVRSLTQSGNYAVAIGWSDGHESLLAFATLERVCRKLMAIHSSSSHPCLAPESQW